MTNITKEELKKFRRINGGGFGSIYEHNGKVYKVYHQEVKTDFGLVSNPVLKHSTYYKNKIKRMSERDGKLIYTDLPEDILLIDDKFQGIVMPYYEGETVLEHISDPLLKKIALSRQMIRNARELTDNHVYPFDYKLINMIVSKNGLKFIDLDDVFTKITTIPNPFYNKRSIGILDETIKAFLRDDDYRVLSEEVRKNLLRQYEYFYTYDSIESYLISRAINHTYILVNEESDLDNETLRDPNYRIIFVVRTSIRDYYSHLMEVLMEFKKHNISVYDIIDEKKLDNYLNDSAHNDVVDFRRESKKLIKK